MKLHITIAEDAGAAPGAVVAGAPGADRQLSVPRATDATGAVDAGPAAESVTSGYSAAPGTEPARTAGAGTVIDGGEAPGWLTELVRLADAGEVARPGEEGADRPGGDAGSAAPVSG
ncbi:MULTISPECIES: hypothetical protein [unclassified Streptomyces]|uniref:hypothetical protein n=1 Tax=unclassified Streptomyces TaxID=2593676 RepID=UPI0036598858